MKFVKKSRLPYAMVVATTGILLGLFQNCGRNGQTARAQLTPDQAREAARISIDHLKETNELVPASMACSFAGQAVDDGGTVTAFQNSTVPGTEECVSEERTCDNGQLSGSYNFASCEVSALKSCTFDGQVYKHGDTVTAYKQVANGEMGVSCESKAITCDNGNLRGVENYPLAACEPQVMKKSCMFNGRQIEHGELVNGYLSSTVPFGETCEPLQMVCDDGEIAGSEVFSYGICQTDQPALCLFNGRTLAHGESVMGFLTAQAVVPDKCQSKLLTCDNGNLPQSEYYVAGSCEEVVKKTCTFDGITYKHGQSVRGYSAGNVPYGQICDGIDMVCDDGKIAGSEVFSFSSCKVDGARSCSFDGKTLASGAALKGYFAAEVIYPASCASKIVSCKDGTLSGADIAPYSSCQVVKKNACTFNGVTYQHGQEITGYTASRVPFGQQCDELKMVCDDGTIAGSDVFSAASCAVDAAKSCTFDGKSYAHGALITGYSSATVRYNQTCSSVAMVCDNGSVAGSDVFKYSNCQVSSPQSCNYNGKTIAHGQSVFGYITSREFAPSSCIGKTLTCDDGSLPEGGAYIYPTCAQTFLYAGSLQGYSVPGNCHSVNIKAWGAGGGGGYGAVGGAGGYVVANLGVNPGEVLTILVGGGAQGSIYWTGGGGGRSSVIRNSSEIVIAAGGGGAAEGRPGNAGGAGGSTSGYYLVGTDGQGWNAPNYGGYGGGGTGYDVPGAGGGGGGGGGYYGGAGGYNDYGGYGGTNYIGGGATGSVYGGSGQSAVGGSDPDYVSGVGFGGYARGFGYNGEVSIRCNN